MTRKTIALAMTAVLLLALLPLAGCQSRETASEDSKLIAKVNDTQLTFEEFNKNFKIFEKNYTQMYGEQIWSQEVQGKTIAQIAKEQIMEKMITEELIRQHMAGQEAEIDREKIDETYAAFEADIESSEEMKAFYEANGIGEAFIKKQLETEAYLSLFKTQALEELGFDETRLAEVYEDTVVNVRARHILVEDEETLKEVQEKLEAGEAFEALAEAYSIDTGSAVQGGDLGYFARGIMVPEFEAAAFESPVGVVTEPVETDFGYHLILVEDKKTLGELAEEMDENQLEAQKEAIRNNLMESKVVEKIDALVEAAEIERYKDNLN